MDYSGMTKTELIKGLKAGSRRIAALEAAHKRGEQTLRRLARDQQMFRLISENAGDLIALVDLEGKRIYNSPSYRQILGSLDRLRGTDSFREIHPDDREKIKAVFQETVRTGMGQRSEYRFQLKDGSIRYIESLGNLIRDEHGNPASVLVVSRDVTEQHFADRKIRLLAQTVASTKDCVAISDLDQKILFVNDAFLQVHGYDEDELLGKNIASILSPLSESELAAKISPALSPDGWNGIIIGKKKDGTDLPLELWTSPVRNETGDPVAVVGVARDITDRLQAERIQQATYRISEAAQSEATFEQLLRTIHSTIGQILPANNFYIALYDEKIDLLTFPYFVDELDPSPAPKRPGKGLTEYVIRTGKPLLATPATFEKLVLSGDVESIGAPSIDWLGVPLTINEKTIGALVVQSYSEETRFTTKDFRVLSFVSAQVAMAIDRRRALEGLRESEARFRAIFERSAIGMVITDLNGKITQTNEAMHSLLGYDAAGLRRLTIWDITHPEDVEPERAHFNLAAANRTGDDLYKGEKRYRHRNGSTVWGSLTSSFVRDQDGVPLFGMGMVENITKRKQGEERLSKLNECFISFGPDPLVNINRLTAVAGELMGATSALYNRLDSGMLHSWGRWHTPANYKPIDSPTGHICFDVIRSSNSSFFVVRDLQQSPYAQTDPNVLRYGLRTYVGHPVRFAETVVGSLCLLYQHDYAPTDDDRRLLGIIAAAISVEEQRKQEAESLRESESRYRSLFENANDAIFLLRGEKIFDCNRKTEEMFGCTEDLILNHTPFDFSPPFQPDGQKSYEKGRALLHLAMNGEPQHFDWKHARSDGVVFDVEVSLTQMEIKGETILQAMVRDVTARKRAEESLRESELRFAVLAEAAFEGIGVSDGGKIVVASDQMASMLGYEVSEMVGMSTDAFVAPESRKLVWQKLMSASTEPYEYMALRKDGSLFPVEVRARALPFKGKVVRVTAIRDITERRRAEEAIRSAEAKFRALIEHSSESIILTDRHGVITYASPASTRMLGYRPNVLTGTRVFDYLPTEDAENDSMQMTRLIRRAGSIVSGAVRFRHEDESWRWLDIVGTNLLDEPAVGAIVLNCRDITERKLAEEELSRSRQMLRLVLDNIPQRVFWKDRNFDFVGCNSSFALDAGLTETTEITGKNDFELPWKDLAPIYRADDADVMETDTPKMNYEEPMVAQDGNTRWLRTSKTPMHDLEGNVIGVLGTYEDITERKRAQEEILMQKTRFQQLYENVSLGIAMLDENDTVVDINPAFTRIFQFSADEIRGKNINKMLVPPEYASEGEELSLQTRHGKTVEEEGWRKRSDGSLAYVYIYGVPMESKGETIGIYGIYEDISERRKAEEKMREQAALLDVSRDAIGVQDLEGNILYWNKGAEMMYGYSAEEVLGGKSVYLYKPESLKTRTEAFECVLRTGEWIGDLHQNTRAGKSVIVQSRWFLVRDSDGQPKSILVVSTDITEKKKLESQFHHAQRLETIGTLAGGIAHDLNNVLAPILMSIELLQTRLSDERAKRLVGTIETSAKRGSDIVKQVLTFARGVEGERVLLQPKHLLRDMERIAIETFPKSIEIRSDIPKGLWTVQGDATQLHQVLLNLCVNARDAMPQGGTLFLRAENVTLDEEGARIHLNAKPGQYILLSVRDTGVGIPAEIKDKIFDPFFTTKEVGKGTGLGLSTVLGIVEGHKGFITVTSEWGTGSEFAAYIPADSQFPLELYVDTAANLPLGNGELILIVDDEAPIREIFRESLESFGYHVLEAKDGMEAAVVFEKNRGEVKLVLTDMMMPTMDGASVVRLLRRINPTIKIIIVSGMAEEDQLTESIRQSVQGYLQKPFKAEKLLKMIDSVLKDVRTPE